jgi:hypothetical protein
MFRINAVRFTHLVAQSPSTSAEVALVESDTGVGERGVYLRVSLVLTEDDGLLASIDFPANTDTEDR